MSKDSLYMRMLPARLALARILVMEYPDAESPDDLPQVLVHSFNVITGIVGKYGKEHHAVTHFDIWWDARELLRDRWKDE